MDKSLTTLKNIGPRCAEWLAAIGIHTVEDFRAVGAPAAYRELVLREIVKPHRMLLYALGGALLDEDCLRLDSAVKRELEEEAGIPHAKKQGSPRFPHR